MIIKWSYFLYLKEDRTRLLSLMSPPTLAIRLILGVSFIALYPSKMKPFCFQAVILSFSCSLSLMLLSVDWQKSILVERWQFWCKDCSAFTQPGFIIFFIFFWRSAAWEWGKYSYNRSYFLFTKKVRNKMTISLVSPWPLFLLKVAWTRESPQVIKDFSRNSRSECQKEIYAP